MTSKDMIDSAETDGLAFGSLGERCVYLLLRYHADKKGVVRISLTEMAARLSVSRRTVNDHVDGLMERRLLIREGHGRYRVHAEPWSPRDVARAYFKTLAPGDEWDILALEHRAYGRSLGDTGEDDERFKELIGYMDALIQGGFLAEGQNGSVVRTQKTAAAA